MQLYLCEKPSQARDIARVLGVKQRGQGCLLNQNVTVTWAIGHLLEMAAPEHYGEQFGPP
ncbi:toprim domain-containing protein, partial [Xenorhabdus bovienii]